MTENIKHAEASLPAEKPSSNPIASSLNVVVSVPDSIEVRMVDATSLADYEVWFFISSVLANAVTGFLVAYIQACNSNLATAGAIMWMTIVFAILFVVSVIMTFIKRYDLKKKGKSIKLKTTEATDI